MRAIGVGRVLFAVSFAGLGALSLASGDFALNWQPVPAWVPWRAPLAYASGALLFAGGLGMLFKRTAALSALVLTVNMIIWLLFLRLPPLLASPGNESKWLGLGETMTLVVGGWILLSTLAVPGDKLGAGRMPGSDGARLARILFGAALLPIGLSHIVYLEATTAFVPAWLPSRVGLSYFTGSAQIAAGLGLLLGILPRLAVTLEAILLGLFTVLVWVPRVVAAQAIRFPATALLISAAVTGAAWLLAGTLDDVAWGRVPWAKRPAASSSPSAASVGVSSSAQEAANGSLTHRNSPEPPSSPDSLPPMRLLAMLVGLLSLGELLFAFVLGLPHSDVPPVASLLVFGAAVAGFALARGLWRRRAGVAGGLAAWGAGVAICVVVLVVVVASPAERRDAWPAVGAGLALWAVLIGLATHNLSRHAQVEAGPIERG